ncbi:methyltransferase type 12 [Podospora didyma]|uniref:Methyltransferase type 12 n=1 Tax=Podospora didyma TaxID=330526 RepID=A0AAE0NQV6_9PEZI|nr:methyltransferase type 12 [Podospora didyma]
MSGDTPPTSPGAGAGASALPSTEAIFDAVGPAYEAAFAGLPSLADAISWILPRLPPNAKALDIGCGTGRPVCSSLAEAGHSVLGIDISSAMLTAARERVPLATFEKVDIRDFVPPPDGVQGYDVVTAFFSLIAGVSQEDIRHIIKKMYGYLKPGGIFVWSTVPLPAENLSIAWMGRPVVVSSLAPEASVAAVREAGFEVEKEELSTFRHRGDEVGICKSEDVWEEQHLFVYARKPE